MNNIGCTTNCQCREDLGLKCRNYADSYTCSGTTFSAGQRCQCNRVTQNWISGSCGKITLFFFPPNK